MLSLESRENSIRNGFSSCQSWKSVSQIYNQTLHKRKADAKDIGDELVERTFVNRSSGISNISWQRQ